MVPSRKSNWWNPSNILEFNCHITILKERQWHWDCVTVNKPHINFTAGSIHSVWMYNTGHNCGFSVHSHVSDTVSLPRDSQRSHCSHSTDSASGSYAEFTVILFTYLMKAIQIFFEDVTCRIPWCDCVICAFRLPVNHSTDINSWRMMTFWNSRRYLVMTTYCRSLRKCMRKWPKPGRLTRSRHSMNALTVIMCFSHLQPCAGIAQWHMAADEVCYALRRINLLPAYLPVQDVTCDSVHGIDFIIICNTFVLLACRRLIRLSTDCGSKSFCNLLGHIK